MWWISHDMTDYFYKCFISFSFWKQMSKRHSRIIQIIDFFWHLKFNLLFCTIITSTSCIVFMYKKLCNQNWYKPQIAYCFCIRLNPFHIDLTSLDMYNYLCYYYCYYYCNSRRIFFFPLLQLDIIGQSCFLFSFFCPHDIRTLLYFF